MAIDYNEIDRRIARRRKQSGLKQSEVEEKAYLSYKYLSNIERSISIPSIEVTIIHLRFTTIYICFTKLHLL